MLMHPLGKDAYFCNRIYKVDSARFVSERKEADAAGRSGTTGSSRQCKMVAIFPHLLRTDLP